MKKLLITLLLVSPFSFAEWGDVYYCVATTNSWTKFGFTIDMMKAKKALNKEGKGTFTLRADKSSKALIFKQTNKGETRETVLPIKEDDREKMVEIGIYLVEADLSFAALSPVVIDGHIDKFDFVYSFLTNTDANFESNTMSADCEKI